MMLALAMCEMKFSATITSLQESKSKMNTTAYIECKSLLLNNVDRSLP